MQQFPLFTTTTDNTKVYDIVRRDPTINHDLHCSSIIFMLKNTDRLSLERKYRVKGYKQWNKIIIVTLNSY